MKGQTLKQINRARFLRAAHERNEAATTLDSPDSRARYVACSLILQTLKGKVPRRMWSLANYHPEPMRTEP